MTPTVVPRRHTRDVTLDQWRTLGATPIVVEQEDGPTGHGQQIITARAAIRAGLNTDADLIVYAEDDIDLDPRLVGILPACIGDAPVSLWHRPRFRPRRLPPGDIVIVDAIQSRTWFSSLCLALPRRVAAALVDQPAPDHGGIDMCLRDWKVRITVPALVEHRPGRRYASRNGRHYTSDTYEGPTSEPS